jgi:hypothetical protein
VDVTEHIGLSFDNPVLWSGSPKTYVALTMKCYLIPYPVKKAKVKGGVKQAFMAYLFFINNNDKKHSQLKKTMAKDHTK